MIPLLLALAVVYPDPDWPISRNPPGPDIAAYERWLRERCGEYWASVVIRNGHLIYQGRGPRCHVRQRNDSGSILKPLQATVLGAALLQKRLKSLDQNAMPYWKDPYVTPFDNDRFITFRQFAQYHDRWNEPEPPGSYHYNNAGATAAGAAIAGLFREVRGPAGRGIAEVARREVMEKIGADWDLWYWEREFVAGQSGNPGPRMVLEASVYELAKLGYLWLHKGQWKRTRIFSEDYYNAATTDWSARTGSDQFGYVGHYGYWWFVNAGRFWLPDVPEDAFYAIGNGNPKRATCLLVIPSLDTVAVLSMERVSDDGKWDVIRNSRVPSNDGPRDWSREVIKLD